MPDRLGRLLLVTLEAARVNADLPALEALRSRLNSWARSGRSRAAELLHDGGPKFVGVDRLRQIALKARRAHVGVSQASHDEGDGRHAASLSDVHAAKPLEKLAVGRLRRGKVRTR